MFYYQNVGLFYDPVEWEQFIEYLHKELPTTFRITSRTSFTEILKSCIQTIFKDDSLKEDNNLSPPTPLRWYPKDLGWYFKPSRKALRTSLMAKHLKHFMIHESYSGNLSRQESVSMIPALFLDVKSHHKILDMCAAPGSKTCQLVELLHEGTDSIPSGFVVANDSNIARCYLLTHQVHRLASPAVIITNYDASTFPSLSLQEQKPKDSSPQKSQILQFDRILCDVPCSGDGTIRKNPTSGSGWDHKKPFKLFRYVFKCYL